jgi:hypothetical protein
MGVMSGSVKLCIRVPILRTKVYNYFTKLVIVIYIFCWVWGYLSCLPDEFCNSLNIRVTRFCKIPPFWQFLPFKFPPKLHTLNKDLILKTLFTIIHCFKQFNFLLRRTLLMVFLATLVWSSFDYLVTLFKVRIPR